MKSGSEGARSLRFPPGVLTDGGVAAYALWTVAANVVVIAGGHRSMLSAAAGFVVIVLLGGGMQVRRGAPWVQAYCDDSAAGSPTVAPRLHHKSWLGGLVLPVLTLIAWLLTHSAWLAWTGALLSAAALFVRAQRLAYAEDHEPVRPLVSASVERIVLHATAAATALFTLLAFRPRSDDTLYLNLAVSVVDAPKQPLLSVLMIHGPSPTGAGPQLMFPPYRVHSFEVLVGLISAWTGVEPAAVVYFGLATLLGWFTPFALARLLRILAPRHWLVALLIVLSFYCIEGSASRGYANHALVRLFDGKAALLTLGVPLVCAYGLRYGARPSAWRFLMLACSQVASVGLSSTGIWLVPVLAMVSVAAATPARRLLPGRLGAGLLSSAYVLGLGLWVLVQLKAGVVEPAEVDLASTSAGIASIADPALSGRFGALVEALPIVLGPPHTAVALLGAVLVCALVAPTTVALRLFSALALLVAAGFGNPFLAAWVGSHITGASTYQRIFWLLPVPVAVALCGVALFAWLSERFKPAYAALWAALALFGFYAVAVDRLVISEANAAKLQFPPVLKLPRHARMVALTVCKLAPTGSRVLASQAVSQQLPIMPGCGYPLIAADRWLAASVEETKNRNALTRVVDDSQDLPSEKAGWFLDALAEYRIDAIVLSKNANHATRTKALVRMAGFDHATTVDWDNVYVRGQQQRHDEYVRVAGKVCGSRWAQGAVLAPFGVSRLIEERHCASVVASPRVYRGATAEAADELLRLERLTYMPGDLPKAQELWLRTALDSRGVTTVVVTRAINSSVRLRVFLAQLGFRKSASQDGYSILSRSLAGNAE